MDYWKAAGNFYGFPDCCSTWFSDRHSGKVDPHFTPAQDEIMDGSGYIPCPSCAEKIYRGETTREELIKDRICKTPYPDDRASGLSKYIKELEKKGLLVKLI